MKARLKGLLCGLIGAGLVSAALPMLEVKALSQSELLEKLAAVSVYVVTNRDGVFITRQGDFPADGLGNIELLNVFFSESDAQSFAEKLIEADPNLRGNGSIGLTNLSAVYDFAAQESDLPRKLSFSPQAEDLRAAVAIDPNFLAGETTPPVPLFTIEDSEGNPIALAFGDSEETYISMFLSSRDAQGILDALNAGKPELQAQLSVYSLKDVSRSLVASDDAQYEKVRFFQSAEVINQNQTLE
ncbi:Tic22 family protein [Leptothoe spongobia]|uniref:Uncharacterized protein n=1 Tax=Leptothoe spongobia TAU-MAC 1115 TaxID=1967444 RepID=A0A947GFS2_9CYAN|nr:Tic22 family protein [Leptothoe spongobia]MBT9313914.1 hypothetical protein [Leptothoe spongobia TAU-MAC 1115]